MLLRLDLRCAALLRNVDPGRTKEEEDRMLVLDILRWDKACAWTDWGGHVRKDLAGRLQSACPSLRLTERKRLAKRIAEGAAVSPAIENPRYAESLSHILEATGAVVRLREEKPGEEAAAAVSEEARH